jgi:hypothetical protein
MDIRDLARRLEEHEAAVWVDCVIGASELPGDPLRAVIERSATRSFVLVALCAVDALYLNRLVGLGVRAPVRGEDLDAIWAFYAANDQRNFRIDVTPDARPLELAEWLTNRGMRCQSPGTFKIWRPAEPPLVPPLDVEVRRLGAADADAIADLNLVAWGAWNNAAMHAWFGATVGRDGWQHYGVFDAHRLVSTGALRTSDGLGWFGFDATHPRHQGKQLRQAISAVRLADAAARGCKIVHAESAIALRPRVFRDGWQSLYERRTFATTLVDAQDRVAEHHRHDD